MRPTAERTADEQTAAAPTQIRARRATPTPVRVAWFRENVLDSLWFIPLVSVVASFVLARVTIEVDTSAHTLAPPHVLFPGGGALLASVSGTIAAAMLTFLAVVFSTTLVAVQLASSQYSPRIVRVFVRSRVTQVTLALFLSTFVVALEALLSIDGSDRTHPAELTATFLYALMLATIITFVVFLHRIIRLLRVQYLLLWVSRAAREVIEQEFPPDRGYTSALRPPDDPVQELEYVGTPGVIQAIDTAGLSKVARAVGGWIELRVGVGEHVGRHVRVARVHSGLAAVDAREIARHLLVGGERTLIQDPAFGIRTLVDTASRALSPAVNDPTTALQALHRIVDLLLRVADRPDPTGWYVDDEGAVRVFVPHDDFERLAVLGVTEILRYGADAPQITRALRAAYDDLEAAAPQRGPLIAALRAQWQQAVAEAVPAAFRDLATVADRRGLG